jgi:nucleotide-binding universal stress UspA family protein
MFNTIIWATDGSDAADRALPYARSLLAEHGNLVVVHSTETFSGSRAAGLPLYADEEAVKEKVERQLAALRDEGLNVEARIESHPADRPAHAIADAAEDVAADVIVVGTRGQTPIGGLLLGSVTHRLLHIAPCPVLAVPAGPRAARHHGEAAEAVHQGA